MSHNQCLMFHLKLLVVVRHLFRVMFSTCGDKIINSTAQNHYSAIVSEADNSSDLHKHKNQLDLLNGS